jgi:hypothetical protein
LSILSPNINNEKSKAYEEKRRLLGSALVIDQLLTASGHDGKMVIIHELGKLSDMVE